MKIRTGYSFRTAFGHLPDVISRLSDIGWTVAPITDRYSTFGFNRWTKLASKAELRPIYGVEIACTPVLGEKKPALDYWTFLAIDSLRPLHDLIYQAGENSGKEPSLTYDEALAAPGLVKIAGERLLLDALPEAVPSHFYGSLAPSTPKGLVRGCLARSIPLLATSDNYYPRPEDEESYRVMLGWRSGTQTYPRWILSDHELLAALPASEEVKSQAFRNRDEVMQLCRATLKRGTLLSPEKPKTLRQLCLDGAKRKKVNLKDPVYKERLDRELKLIDEKKFEDYFFILTDIIGWAKKQMIVGPARGSSCGSLVCYLLDITAIDPIPFGLIFERFIDINRMDLPDIDVDFSDAQRNKVFDYVEERYGAERVARLGTVGLFKPRSAIKQAGASLRIPQWRTNKVLDSIIERSSGDARAMNALEDTLKETPQGQSLLKDHPEIEMAARFEGHPNTSSQHAAGVIVTQEPIREYVAVDYRTKAAWCDKKDAEDLNLLKIDALGLTQLSIFERTLELIDENPISGWLEKIPLDDPTAFAVLNNRHYSGIFQFVGNAMRSLANMIHYEKLDDIVATTALARPGPFASGGSTTWAKRRMGLEIPKTLHPMLSELTKETYGVVIFQETVMRIVRELGRMSWEDTSAIRKAMSGRLGDEFFAKYWIKFRDGAKENGVDESTAKQIWDQINTFGSWSFNKSHAVAYGVVSYWCCWLKAHHPIEFAAATLDAENDPLKQIAILRELAREGIEYVAVDPEHSTDRWTPAERDGRTILVGPLTMIKGIGPAKLQTILDHRKLKKELSPALQKQLRNAKTPIDSLFPIRDRLDKLYDGFVPNMMNKEPDRISDLIPGQGAVNIIGVVKRINPRDENEEIQKQKRNGAEMFGPTRWLNMFVADDTDEIYCKVGRFQFELDGLPIVENGKVGSSIYAINGIMAGRIKMINVMQTKYLGELE